MDVTLQLVGHDNSVRGFGAHYIYIIIGTF